MFLFGIITWSCSLSLITKHDHQPQNFRGSFCLLHLVFYYLLLNPSKTSIHIYRNNSTCINTAINKHPLALDPSNKTQHNHVLVTYWTQRNLINHVNNVQYCVYIFIMSWQISTQHRSAWVHQRCKDDLRCSFDKQITSIPSLSTLTMPVGPCWPSDFFDSN